MEDLINSVNGVTLKRLEDEINAVNAVTLKRMEDEINAINGVALFTVEKSMNDPRYPTVPNRFLAERQEIEEIEASSLGIDFDSSPNLSEFMSFSPPRPKPKKVFTPDSNLSPSERMRLIMSGGMAGKKGDLVETKPEEAAKRIMDVLIQESVVNI